MFTPRSLRWNRLLALLISLILFFSFTQIAYANVRVERGGDVPFYGRIGSGEVYHTNEWAVIVFYRPTACIPSDFNLLEFFHLPDSSGPGAFGCVPPTTVGFEIWKNGPFEDPAPIQTEVQGLGAVPIWFVPWTDMEKAILDNSLTIVELASLDPLIGYASFYKETLHPTGGGPRSMIEYTARGQLEDGSSFFVQAHATEAYLEPKVKITFR